MNQFTLTIHEIGLNTAFRDLKSTLIKIKLFLTGLSTQLISKWIKHPQAFLYTGKSSDLILIIRLYWLMICCICTPCINTVLGVRVESQRKRSHFAVLCRQCFAATQPTCVNPLTQENYYA